MRKTSHCSQVSTTTRARHTNMDSPKNLRCEEMLFFHILEASGFLEYMVEVSVVMRVPPTPFVGPACSHCLPWLRSLFSLSPSLSGRFSSWFSTDESGSRQCECVDQCGHCVSREWTSESSVSTSEYSICVARARVVCMALGPVAGCLIPSSTASAERNFSALKRLKTYLLSTIDQDRLNHLVILRVYNEQVDNLDIDALCDEFVKDSTYRIID
uniref:HAT C-terminal dimerisation domain-containing protein n=1 Tax=Timema monikensis TaxID=170555 RepID=A0A7R9DZG0_9NEOP|nr:unnamed protein product [Timema monikensis]